MKSLGTFAALALAASATPAAAAVYTYTGSGGALLDLSTFTSTIAVTDDFVIQDVDFTLNDLNHSWLQDLRIELVRNGATGVVAADGDGIGGGADGDFTFDDEASLPIQALSGSGGTYRPRNSLSAFDGGSATGSWQLRISDLADGDTGTLGSWTLTLTGSTVEGPVPEPGTWAMLILGFGAVGGAMRRRRQSMMPTYA